MYDAIPQKPCSRTGVKLCHSQSGYVVTNPGGSGVPTAPVEMPWNVPTNTNISKAYRIELNLSMTCKYSE